MNFRGLNSKSVIAFPEKRIALARYERWGSSVAAFINSNSPDTLHLHDALAPVVLRFLDFTALSEVHVVYDAHEWVEGLAREKASTVWDFALELEKEVTSTCTKVVTVSDELAVKLRAQYHLPEVDVVKNFPYIPITNGSKSASGHDDVKSQLGLSQSSFLMVYQGVVKPERGLLQVIPALVSDDTLHLALLCDRKLPHVGDLIGYAVECGVREQLHILPYVPSARLVNYISGADAGIHPIQASNNAGIALPNKFFEYLAAQLPIVVSAIGGKMEQEVRVHGLGECFKNDDTKDLIRAIEMLRSDHGSYRDKVMKYSQRLSWNSQKTTMWDLWSGKKDSLMHETDLPFTYMKLESYSEA